ncbi:GDSL-type esterase/lipase family protein [Microbacterium sp. Au-Mic1]|uniref:GDSL-type esterase/lipase family protein n=1 Tax=Microbacterium sp. Au-Mic1 TaxID=2906457 RepID=UPI001E3DEABF|nr:GDSL-type esterase/lipase family protein [Microbacterium sp. Au-Mic1]MCE4024563.1 GDSL-type esterase/lipase family protein [Microbacterium sp. Au-Mic1]
MLGTMVLVAVLAGAGLLLAWQLPRPVSTTSAIGVLWHHHDDELGAAWNHETCRAGVCRQDFRAGTIYAAVNGFAHIVRAGAVGAAFDELGGVARLGMPIAEQSGSADRPWQAFQHAGIFANGDDAPILVRGALWRSWLRYSQERGGLGFPKGAEHADRRGTVVQEFVNGMIYMRDGRAVPTISDIADAHRRAAGASGPLGYPKSTQRAVGDRLVQEFDGGEVWWSAGTGAASVQAPFLAAYHDRGGAGGALGLPTADASRLQGGSMQTFQGGALYRSDKDEAVVATAAGDIQNRYEELGGPEGELGLPAGEKIDVAGGRYQAFAGGVLVWHEGAGVFRLDAENFAIWAADPARFGWPTKDTRVDDRGAHQDWEKAQTVLRAGRLLTVPATAVDGSTAVLICDSQCSGDSWIDQGARSAGFPNIAKFGYPGSGYLAPIAGSTAGVVESVARNRVLLPEGDPGVVIVTLGGNDTAQKRPAAEVVAAEDQLIGLLRQAYPNAPIVVNGVMSRSDAAHAARRTMDAVVTEEARNQGVAAISVAGWVSDYSAPQADAVHLTPAGHARIAPHYAEALRAALGR